MVKTSKSKAVRIRELQEGLEIKKARAIRAEGAYVEVGERTEMQRVDHGEPAQSMVEETRELSKKYLRLKREVERDEEDLRRLTKKPRRVQR